MAIKVISRTFDPHLAAEIVVLENSLGVRHHLTVHIGDHEGCSECGRPANKKAGVVDVEKVIEGAIVEWTAHEKKLLKHARTRKK
jgi:hypothetical protein